MTHQADTLPVISFSSLLDWRKKMFPPKNKLVVNDKLSQFLRK